MSVNLGFFNQQDRELFEALRKEFPNQVISQSYLRQQQLIENGKGAYQFSFINPQGGTAPLPNRLLNVTDIFVATRLGLYLLKEATNEPGGFELQSYPNPTYFPAVAGFNPQDLEVFYAGNLALSTNNIILINAAPTKRFRSVPQTLQSAVNSKSEIDLSDGMVPVVPYPRFSGTMNLQLQVNVPIFTGMEVASATAGISHQLVAYAEGFLIAQGSPVGQGS